MALSEAKIKEIKRQRGNIRASIDELKGRAYRIELRIKKINQELREEQDNWQREQAEIRMLEKRDRELAAKLPGGK